MWDLTTRATSKLLLQEVLMLSAFSEMCCVFAHVAWALVRLQPATCGSQMSYVGVSLPLCSLLRPLILSVLPLLVDIPLQVCQGT